MVLQKSQLSDYIKEKLLTYLNKEYTLLYNHFDVYRGISPVEYQVTFPEAQSIIVIRAYYKDLHDMIHLDSITIHSTDERDEPYVANTGDLSFESLLKKRMIYVNNLLFKENTL